MYYKKIWAKKKLANKVHLGELEFPNFYFGIKIFIPTDIEIGMFHPFRYSPLPRTNLGSDHTRF